MKNKAQLNDIVQLTENHKWCGALVQVTELSSFGIQGFIYMPEYGDAFIRVNECDYEVIGKAIIARKDRA